jgi:iron complex outermembrane receptor protein
MRHIGRIAVDDRNRDFAPAATVFNVRLSLAQNRDRWTFREFLRIDNLADRNYVGSVIVNEGNQRYFEPAPGRTWLVGVNAAYAF